MAPQKTVVKAKGAQRANAGAVRGTVVPESTRAARCIRPPVLALSARAGNRTSRNYQHGAQAERGNPLTGTGERPGAGAPPAITAASARIAAWVSGYVAISTGDSAELSPKGVSKATVTAAAGDRSSKVTGWPTRWITEPPASTAMPSSRTAASSQPPARSLPRAVVTRTGA